MMKDIFGTAFMFTVFAGVVALAGGAILFLASAFLAPDLNRQDNPLRHEAVIAAASEKTPA